MPNEQKEGDTQYAITGVGLGVHTATASKAGQQGAATASQNIFDQQANNLFGTQPANGGGLFGQQQQQQQQQQVAFSFGTAGSQQSTAGASSFGFGAGPTNQPMPGGIFGATTNAGWFGTALGQSPAQLQTGGFGASQAQNNIGTTAGWSFGAANNAAWLSALFSNTTTAPTATGAFGFGATSGAAAAQTNPAFSFGNAAASTSAPSAFGSNMTAAGQPAAGGCLFGTSTAWFSAGTATAIPATSRGIFGAGTSFRANPATGGLFGTNQVNSAGATRGSLYGASTAASTSAGLLGSKPVSGQTGGQFGGNLRGRSLPDVSVSLHARGQQGVTGILRTPGPHTFTDAAQTSATHEDEDSDGVPWPGDSTDLRQDEWHAGRKRKLSEPVTEDADRCVVRRRLKQTSSTHWDQVLDQVPDRKAKPRGNCMFCWSGQKKESGLCESCLLIWQATCPFKCDEPGCNFASATSGGLNKHKKTHDVNRPKPFKCDEPGCDFAAATSDGLRKHKKTHDPNRPKPFTCDEPGCDYASARSGDLERHQKTHDSNRPKPFTCDEPGCDFAAGTSDGLRKHKKTHDSNRPKPFT
ncbi:hypothetical protein OC861_006236, partial [Tilletia horrida]